MTINGHQRFDVRVFSVGDTFGIAPVGDLDLATIDALEGPVEAAIRRGASTLLLDLSQLTFMDTSGLRLILGLDARARDGEFTFMLAPGPPAVQRIFEITGLIDQLPFEERIPRLTAEAGLAS